MFFFPSHLFLSRIKHSPKKPQNTSKKELECLLFHSSSNQSRTEDHAPVIENKILTSREINNLFSMWSLDWRPLVLLKFTTSEELLWRGFTWHKDSFVLVRESRCPPINNMASGWFSFSFSESISLFWILIRTNICCVPVTFNRIKKIQLCEDSEWKLFEAGLCELSETEGIFYFLTLIFTALSLKIGMSKMHFHPSLKHFVYTATTADKSNKILIFYYKSLFLSL